MGLDDRDYMRRRESPDTSSETGRMSPRDWLLAGVVVLVVGGGFVWKHWGQFWFAGKHPLPTEAQRAGKVSETSSEQPHLINLNTASQAELERLPTVGPKTAQLIIAHRPYKHERDLLKIPSFGQSKLSQVLPYVTVGE